MALMARHCVDCSVDIDSAANSSILKRAGRGRSANSFAVLLSLQPVMYHYLFAGLDSVLKLGSSLEGELQGVSVMRAIFY